MVHSLINSLSLVATDITSALNRLPEDPSEVKDTSAPSSTEQYRALIVQPNLDIDAEQWMRRYHDGPYVGMLRLTSAIVSYLLYRLPVRPY